MKRKIGTFLGKKEKKIGKKKQNLSRPIEGCEEGREQEGQWKEGMNKGR